MVIVLNMAESTSQVISGIPEYVEFTTDVPSTVFYTLDDSTPDSSSDIAVGKVFLPTSELSFTLKAVAIANSFSSAILEGEYSVDQVVLDRYRLVDDEGINILPYGETPIDSMAFDADGDEAKQSVIEFVDLDIIASKTTRIGEKIPDDSSVEFIKFQSRDLTTASSSTSTPNNNVNFNPKASVILIDGYNPDDISNQEIRIINRPHGSMAVVSEFYNEHLESRPLISGNFVRYMYNPDTGKIAFYYYESRENRWIRSVQKVDDLVEHNFFASQGSGQRGMVFRWIEDRAISRLF